MGIVLLVAYALDNWGSELPLPLEPIDGGHCGEHVEWELYNDGTLKISGAGYMKDYLHDGRQEDEDKKIEAADFVIYNNGDMAELKRAIDDAIAHYK